jgi:hypothetical protein
MDFLANELNANTANFNSLLYAAASPGNVCKISEAAMYEALERVCSKVKGIRLTEAAGLLQLAVEGEPMQMKNQLFEMHYARTR